MPIHLDIVTPEKKILTLDVDSVRAPGSDGSFGVLPGHTPFVSVMEPGELIYSAGGLQHSYFVGGGFVEVRDDHVIVLAESAERVEDIDIDRATLAMREAQERLMQLKEEEDAASVERARVVRAAVRISLGRRK